MTPANFFTKMKGFASELAAIGKPVDEYELVGFILNGLDGSYNSLVSSVNANLCTGLNDLYDQICSHNQRQVMLTEMGQDAEDFHSSANVAHHDCPADHDQDRRPRRDGHGDHGGHGYRDRAREEEDRHRRDDEDHRHHEDED
jgi:hypothetical protein